jgi:carboxyl-terminal processing protease
MQKGTRYALISCLLVVVYILGGVSGVAVDRVAIAAANALNKTPANALSPTQSNPSGSQSQATDVPPSGTLAPEASSLNVDLINEVWKNIQEGYVDRSAIKPTDLTYAAISGMVTALGDTGHTRFLTPSMVQQENNQIQGGFDGVGIEINYINNQVVVVAPIDGTPAMKAGIKPGEIFQKVDGVDVTSWTLDEVVSHVLGPAGTQVTLTLYDPATKKSIDYVLTRAHITITNVTWTMLPGTTLAYINIAQFANNVDKDLITYLKAAQEQHATGIVLDLRNDPGGLLDQAVAVTSQFKSQGLVMEEKDAKGNITPIPVERGGVATEIPVVILVNQGTASAAEIVTVALQDGKRATIVGQTTIGTGTVLEPIKLSDGSELLLATSEWLTPSGASFWHKGVAPDIEVALADGVYPLTAAAIKAMSADELKASQDAQLLKAIEILTTPAK